MRPTGKSTPALADRVVGLLRFFPPRPDILSHSSGLQTQTSALLQQVLPPASHNKPAQAITQASLGGSSNCHYTPLVFVCSSVMFLQKKSENIYCISRIAPYINLASLNIIANTFIFHGPDIRHV